MSTDQQSAASAPIPAPVEPMPMLAEHVPVQPEPVEPLTVEPELAEPAPAAQSAADMPAVKKNLIARIKHAAHSTVSKVKTPVLYACIALMQSLHVWIAGKQDAGAEAPARRMRTALVFISLLLTGGISGSVITHQMLQKRFNASIAISTAAEIKPITGAAVIAIKKTPDPAQPEPVTVTEKNPAPAPPEVSDVGKQLEEAQAARISAEKKLAASQAEHAKSAAAQQKKLDAAEKRLTMMARAGKPVPLKTGNCSLSGNANALKDCIENFNR